MTAISVIDCANCAKEIFVRTAELNRGNGKYCSRTCANQAINKHRSENKIPPTPNVKCDVCDLAIYKKASVIKKSTNGKFYCCKEHSDIGRKLGEINCIQCNKRLISGQYKFCSNSCQGENTYRASIQKWKDGKIEGINSGEQICAWLKRYLIENTGTSVQSAVGVRLIFIPVRFRFK